jgi:hypothetical protein
MPKIFNNFVKGYVYGLSKANYSYSQIIKCLKEEKIEIHKSSLTHILKSIKIKNHFDMPAEKILHKETNNKIRTPLVLKQVQKMVKNENPPTQKIIANKIGTSAATINKIINKDLQLRKVKKSKVHRLTEYHIQRRFTNCRFFYENYLSGDKWKYVITVDEAWVYLKNCDKKRSICYVPRGKIESQKCFKEKSESFSKGFMVFGGICYNGKLKLRKIDSNAKVNSDYYQNNILSPLFREELENLYGNDVSKVVFHHDKASSHTSHSTTLFLENAKEEFGINYVPNNRIPIKSPDVAPMDYCVFGLLKYALGKRRPTTLDGLWKAVCEEWDRLDLAILRRCLLSWKIRCRAVVKRRGLQIEHDRRKKYGLYFN